MLVHDVCAFFVLVCVSCVPYSFKTKLAITHVIVKYTAPRRSIFQISNFLPLHNTDNPLQFHTHQVDIVPRFCVACGHPRCGFVHYGARLYVYPVLYVCSTVKYAAHTNCNSVNTHRTQEANAFLSLTHIICNRQGT